MSIFITITQEDIDSAYDNICPVVIAVERLTGVNYAYVHSGQLEVWDLLGRTLFFDLPKRIVKWVKQFDRQKYGILEKGKWFNPEPVTVKPITFTVTEI